MTYFHYCLLDSFSINACFRVGRFLMAWHFSSGKIALHCQLLNACVYICTIRLSQNIFQNISQIFCCSAFQKVSQNILLFSIFDRCNLPRDEVGVQCGTFISEQRIVHHVRSRDVPAIACFLVLLSNFAWIPDSQVVLGVANVHVDAVLL